MDLHSSVRRALASSSFIALLLASSAASANTPEALLGLGARANGMGGAGTAISNDFTSVYYNPAGLGYCGRSEVGFDLRHTAHGLYVRSDNPDVPDEERPNDTTRATIGACFRLPYRLSLGIIFGTGLQRSATIDQASINATPQFSLYGESNDQLTIGVGLAYRPVRQLAIGVGASIIINSALDISVYAPIGVELAPTEYDAIGFDLHWSLSPTAAPYIGVIVQPIPEIKLAATFRGALKHHLDIPVQTEVRTGDFYPGLPELELELPLIVTADTWYQPRELAIGVAVDPIPALTITADLTWYNYAAFNDSPYPFLGLSWDGNSSSFLPAIIGLTATDPIGFRDIWQPRIGVEGRLLDSRLAVRGGYSVRRASVAIPVERNSNILDNTVNSVSIGAGYIFGPRTQEEIAARAAERRAREQAATRAADGAQSDARAEDDDAEPVVRAFGDDRGDLDEAQGTMPVMLRLDGYFRANVMRERVDTHKQMSYGGNVLEVGLTTSLGWY